MLWLLLFPFVIIVPFIGSYLCQPGSPYSDLLISHVPNAIYLRQALSENLSLPLWSPTILSGYPYAANPLAGIWYPPGWLGFLVDMPVGFNLAFSLHLLWGGLGTYLFLRRERLVAPAALLGAVLFEMMPKIWSHYFAGHITLVYAVSWTPWLLLAEKDYPSNLKKHRYLFFPGVPLGMILLADVRWAAYAAILWAAYAFYIRISNGSLRGEGESRQIGFGSLASIGSHLFHFIRQGLVQGGVAVLIASPLILPLVEYIHLSTRSLLTAADVLTLSLPPERLLGLFIPEPGGYAEWVLYPSAVALIMGFTVICSPVVRRKAVFWIGVAFVGLIVSLGSTIPLFSLLVELPGFNLLRVPPRALFITGLSLAVLAGYGLDLLIRQSHNTQPEYFQVAKIVLVALVEVMVLITAGVWWIDGTLPYNYVWATLWITAVVLLVTLRFQERISPQLLVSGILMITFLELGVINWRSFEPRSQITVFLEGEPAAAYLDTQPKPFRLYSPSYSMPQHTAAAFGFELVDGVDPLQLAGYVAFMEQASGIPADSYSVTLPPFVSGNPRVDNRAYLPNPQLLGMLNVRFVLSEFELLQDGFTLRARLGDTRLYENLNTYPRAWIQSPADALGQNAHPVPILQWEPEHILLTAQGPGLLVLSEIHYPGWQVWVDGQRAEISAAPGLLRRVILGPGSHIVEFVFRPMTVYLGILLGIFTWLALSITHLLFLRGKQ